MSTLAGALWHFAVWSEATQLGTWIRSSQYAFPMIEFVHLAALAVIGGAVIIVDMRMLGFGLTNVPLTALVRDTKPWLMASLIVMLITGISLYTSEATKCFASPAFWIKMISLLLAIVFTYTIKTRVSSADEKAYSRGVTKMVGAISLVLWFGVAWGGRWIGFGA